MQIQVIKNGGNIQQLNSVFFLMKTQYPTHESESSKS